MTSFSAAGDRVAFIVAKLCQHLLMQNPPLEEKEVVCRQMGRAEVLFDVRLVNSIVPKTLLGECTARPRVSYVFRCTPSNT